MAPIYERYLCNEAVDRLVDSSSWWQRLWRPGKIGISKLRMDPGGKGFTGGLEVHKRDASDQKVDAGEEEFAGGLFFVHFQPTSFVAEQQR